MVGIRLASGVVTPLVKKHFRAQGPGAALVDRPVRISSWVAPREQRVLHRDDLHFFTTRSTFIPHSLVEQSRRQAALIAKVDALLARIPRQDGRDADFEARYLEYLVKRHGSLTIFGIDLPPGDARWPLDTAYVALEAIPGARHTGTGGGGGGGGGEEGGAARPAHGSGSCACPSSPRNRSSSSSSGSRTG
ncbi:hypothetical protein SAVIM338S_04162 [Streptomyces avidinii]